jgi:glycosyltransferase involved in cell wall biosynthesis
VAALQRAQHVVVTSASTARILTVDFAVPAGKLSVAEPGTDLPPHIERTMIASPGETHPRARTPAKLARERAIQASEAIGSRGALRLLAVGSIVPRKAYDLLVQALARLAGLDWELTIVGDRERSPATTEALEFEIRHLRLKERIRLTGALDEGAVGDLYARADLVVMSSLYEGYGMVLGEALAHGLPIVTTTGGAAAETVPDGAALKVPPGDVEALATALRRAMTDAALRKKLADAAWAAGQRLPRWEDTARIVAGVIGGAAP